MKCASLTRTRARNGVDRGMRRFYINCYVPSENQFPVNTYCTDHVEKVQECVRDLLGRQSGITRVEIIDSTSALPLLGMAPWDLDQSRAGR